MNSWQWSKSWILVWIVSLSVAGLILYAGYLSVIPYPSQERAQTMNFESAQALSTNTAKADGNKAAAATLVENTKTSDQTTGGVREPIESVAASEVGISNQKALSNKDFASPVQGKILRDVGNYYSAALDKYLFHAGVDYAEPEGTIIRTTHGGNVIYSGLDPILGKKVILDCGEGWVVTYGCLDNLRVQTGETVKSQEALGQVGFSSCAESKDEQPQLHYEVWHGDVLVRDSKLP